MRTTASVLICVLAVAAGANAQELSTEVYPSEDELYEALVAGDIDYHQFVSMMEAIRSGLDATNRHLFDEIPNLSYFVDNAATLTTSLQREQESPFKPPPVQTASGMRGTARWRYSQYLDEASESQYHLSGSIDWGDWTASLYVRSDYTSAERITGRYIAYRSNEGLMRELRLGSFTRRFGLGSAFGYRGRLLGSSHKLDSESFLFPDYGGSNGVYARLRHLSAEVQVLASLDRDSDHRLATMAGMVTLNLDSFRPGLSVGVNRLHNRETGSRRDDVKVAPTAGYHYRGGYAEAEACYQANGRTSHVSTLVEGRHRFSTAQIKYSAWSYRDAFLDLSSGSKSGGSRRYHYLDDVDFEFSERRSGHRGGMLKTIVLLWQGTRLVNSFVYSGQHRDSSDLQLLSGLLYQARTDLSWRLDHLAKSRRRWDDGPTNTITHRTRLEVRFTAGETSLRSYIAYSSQSGRSDFLSAFVRLDCAAGSIGRLQLWSNLARLNGRSGNVEYWYLYLRNEQLLWEGVTLAVKVSHRYDRDAGEHHRTALSLEVRSVW